MKTAPDEAQRAPIVQLLEEGPALELPDRLPGATRSVQAPDLLTRARAFAEPLLSGRLLDTGEDQLAHADGVVAILAGIGASPSIQAAAYLVYAAEHLAHPEEATSKAFGPSFAELVEYTRKLMRIQRAARAAHIEDAEAAALQLERVRKMLLAFSKDLRVVLLRLASRLQSLRWHAAARQPCPHELALESRQVFAPLANRLGIWQIKWELEDLAFRFLEPEPYHGLAKALHEKRLERELRVHQARAQLSSELQRLGVSGEVQGRPKHLYSIWKKMQGKGLTLERVFDLRALRVVVETVDDCYTVLARLHELYTPVDGEFDDYIARPKANGYQSLHTVVRGTDGRTMEVQIRTRAMHEHAEHGVAAHWAYKEAGAKGYAGQATAGDQEAQVREARKAVLRQLLAWERDLSEHSPEPMREADARLFVFTPQAAVIELCAGATPIDFAYHVHTDLGHRIRGAKVDGQLVPLNTPLQSGQTVEVLAVKERGPSLDWLNPELGFLASPRSRAKVRAWFNALHTEEEIARGREAVEKLLAREGKTAIKHDELAERLGFKNAEQLFEVVGKDEFSLKPIEQLLRPTAAPDPQHDDEAAARQHVRPAAERTDRGGVLVVGVDSLLTNLARCCRPAPPDTVRGFVTRGRGVAIHRADCSNLREALRRDPEREIDVTWGNTAGQLYPVELSVEAQDRPGVMRDVLEVFAKLRLRVSSAKTQTQRGSRPDTQWMAFTLELPGAEALQQTLRAITQVPGVRAARRR
ncbi:RelA/SpoT family protein [Inhella gelatinilytica]|uniref:GTP pyrophosphokinase n=1 Tax=Inhella gelatinilytica TaxID=2795030 RepID=A0A931NBX5_9BURK|nr:bifunctional (p)ppGpp synthetase/guanosine-3',5'-bis(diphosphate) 3'-pyrophosphohydrolase [Inhella gelatinilytica]MBH9554058.1 bifunctional (p)ppGpp synthetase/guanosine-3',5'-bis(diphosphate) 3'-pyrophosphohydrolase [Inhella gelatinilytica]